jgi:chromosome segregation ATPase
MSNNMVLKRKVIDLQVNLDRITAERDALQQHMNVADQRADDLQTQLDELEQRHRAEFEAGQAAERRVEQLEELLQMFIDNSDDGDVVELSRHALKPATEGALKPAEGGGDE